ncbi:MAG TPA: hypothetical protein DCE56_42590 [Cyanobacteria bacterium UBA8553]|nr:hypothetical protein [Cyanobacteria bacterium UBA8553]
MTEEQGEQGGAGGAREARERNYYLYLYCNLYEYITELETVVRLVLSNQTGTISYTLVFNLLYAVAIAFHFLSSSAPRIYKELARTFSAAKLNLI